MLSSMKRVTLPNTDMDLPSVSEKDVQDIIFGMDNDVGGMVWWWAFVNGRYGVISFIHSFIWKDGCQMSFVNVNGLFVNELFVNGLFVKVSVFISVEISDGFVIRWSFYGHNECSFQL